MNMKLMKKYNGFKLCFLLLAGVWIALTVHSCDTDGCLDNRSSLPIAGFYSYELNSEYPIDSVTIGGIDAPGDSLLLRVGEQAKQIYLPFSSERKKVQFAICYKWQQAPDPDTITFEYTTIPYFASEECGAMYRYTIDKYEYTTVLLDSMVVVDSLITNVEKVNIKLFYRTENPR